MQVEIRNISKHFGILKANDNISFCFEAGRIYAILGENGAGKSTLMKILSGYQQPTNGQLVIDDQAVVLENPNQAIYHGIGMLYQDPLDFAPLSVLENYISGRSGGLLLNRHEALADFHTRTKQLSFDLNPHALVETLTVGERQQLEIIRLLSLGVRFLILDEPTTGISAEQKTQLFQTLKQLAKDRNLTVVLVSHKLQDVEELCDEVLVLRSGQLVGHRVLPCPTELLVEMMFGKRLEKYVPAKMQTGKPILTIEHLPVRARLFSIPEINLQVHEGEVIGLAGLDGSGQVEFMAEIAGLHRSTWADHIFSLVALGVLWLIFNELLEESEAVLNLARFTLVMFILVPLLSLFGSGYDGKVILKGITIGWRGYRDLQAKGIAYLSAGRTEDGLVSGLMVMEHVALANRSGVPWVNWLAIWRHTKALIQEFNIKGRSLDPIQNLSGGNQQRTALALLPKNLQVLLLENPMRGLDVESAQYIWSLLMKRREQGTCIIFYSPDLDEIIDYSDRVLVFSSGKVTLVENAADMTTARLGELIGGKP